MAVGPAGRALRAIDAGATIEVGGNHECGRDGEGEGNHASNRSSEDDWRGEGDVHVADARVRSSNCLCPPSFYLR